MRLAACVKVVDLRPEIDRLSGVVSTSDRTAGISAADSAAVEVGLRLAEAWGVSLSVVCAGGPAADSILRELLAAGASRAIRVDFAPDAQSGAVAAALSAALDGVDLVVCGEYSADRGSGSVPAFLAHHLSAAQALGLVAVDPAESGRVFVTRRLGGGRSERLELSGRAVLSVEGSVARLRRAPLSAVLASAGAPVEVVAPIGEAATFADVEVAGCHPLRPRPRVLPPPAGGAALGRIVELTGALVDRTPPRTVFATPAEAADLIIEQLREWDESD
jgi:electron transfer flavoprotein beta subunit